MRSKFPVAVHLFLLKGDTVLLLRRWNTGYEDGNYSVVAGHVEEGETVTEAAIREAREEVGIHITAQDLEVVEVMHRKSDDERVDFFLMATTWSGELTNQEKDKCDEIGWFSLGDLPRNIIPYVRRALDNYQQGVLFEEYGW
jgi:ADP-ribose pyrophosphatase YjhB (NUDIX family)